MAADNEVVSALTIREIGEDKTLYTSAGVDALLTQERNAAIERENVIKELIEQNDDCFDDMCTALNDLADEEELPEEDVTIREIADRCNLMLRALQRLREGILD
jgi:methylaspartate ammonia-lyase